MKIKVKYHNSKCKIESYGDWIDLKAAEKVIFSGPSSLLPLGNNPIDAVIPITFDNQAISLGISMQLPKGFEANIVPRSSTYKKFGIISQNHYGVVDNEYCGDNDIWGFPAIALRNTTIQEGDRICQFRVRPSQRASWWIKLKWLFVNKVEFVEVEHLGNPDRGGFGSTN